MKNETALFFFIFLSTCFCPVSFADDNKNSSAGFEYDLFETVKTDYKNYYSWDNLKVIIAGFTAGAILANTDADGNLLDGYQKNWRSSGTDDFAKGAKNLGEGKYLIPVSLAAAVAGYYLPEGSGASDIGTWGLNTTRAYLVGAPPMLLMQVVTGASRPGEISDGSDWRPFRDNNGVSGHAFMGAVPFITLAKMYKDSPVRWLYYGASFLAGWSRVNDGDHYISQSALGWMMAFQSVNAVFLTDKEKENHLSFNLYPYGSDGAGFLLSFSW